MNRFARCFSLAALRRHALLLATLLLTAPLPAYYTEDDAYVEGDIIYDSYHFDISYKITDEKATIANLGCSYSNDLTIRSTLSGYPVTAIGDYAFAGCSSLTSVTIPEGVTTIGHAAFCYCISLTSATIPESVITIGDDTFTGSSSLPRDENGFRYESQEKKVLIEAPDWLAEEFVIPDSVRLVHSSAFSGCSSLTSVTIPEGVISIGSEAFSGCTSLPTDEEGFRYESQEKRVLIETPDTLAGEYVIPASVRFVHSSAFAGRTSLTSVTIPEGVLTIGAEAFKDCTSLTSVTIPSSVTFIASSAFSGCSSLSSVTILNGEVAVGPDAFSGVAPERLSAAFVPTGMSTEKLTTVTIPEGVTSICFTAFKECASLTSVTIPSSVTFIGSSAFSGCSSLPSVKIPEGVPAIRNATFSGCSSLTSVMLPE
ncbi:MAG: leucine-rich repeat domain-containing protein, partial [Candidatus Spyradenecus sp.]